MNSHAAIIHPHLNSEDESMIEAFLSSCSRDRIQIDSVYDILKECSVMAWASHREVRPGRPWDRDVEKALHEASSVVVFWTKNSVESEEVLNEANIALEQSKLIPVRLEPCEIPYRFKRLHHIDLQGWDGCPEDPNMSNLITCIKECSPEHG